MLPSAARAVEIGEDEIFDVANFSEGYRVRTYVTDDRATLCSYYIKTETETTQKKAENTST